MLGTVALILGWIFDGIPLVRSAWRGVLERNLEVAVEGPIWQDGQEELKFTFAIEETKEFSNYKPNLFVLFTLTLVNHRTDRLARIRRASISIKPRHLILWKKTLATAPIHIRGDGQLVGPYLLDVALDPLSAAMNLQCVVQESFDKSLRESLTKRFQLWLVLEMVGPVRKIERKVSDGIRQPVKIHKLSRWDL